MPLERVGLEAIFDTREFQRGQRIYEQGVNAVNASTKKAADDMTKSWGTGVDDMLARLDVMKAQTDEMAASLAKSYGEVGAAAVSGMSIVAAATVGVGIGLAIVGAGVAAVYGQMDEAAAEYLKTTKYLEEAQGRVDKQWEEAAAQLAQSVIPLKRELLTVEMELAKWVTELLTTYKQLTAMAHASLASVIESIKVLPGIARDILEGEVPSFEDIWKRITDASEAQFRETMLFYRDVFAEEFPEETEDMAEEIVTDYEAMADAINSVLRGIEDAQIAHNRRLFDLADNYHYEQERAWEKYADAVSKEIQKGEEALADIGAKYAERRDEAIADATKRRLEAETDLNADLLKSQEDYERQTAQSRERFDLDQVQSERRYQYERSRLVAETDTLALEELDARYALEQQEAAENEALRVKQAEETQAALVEAMEAAGRAQAEVLAEALAEQLQEQVREGQEEIAEQQEANRDRIDEMAAAYDEQQRLADEDYQRTLDKADLNYQRQQEDLGRNLARQEELQELSGQQVAWVLEQYYGADGVNQKIMDSYFTWLEEQAIIAATTVAAAMGAVSQGAMTGLYTGGVVGMQEGGILTGPAMAYVEPGVVEAFIPLSSLGGGGSYDLSWTGGPIPIKGLEGAPPSDVSAIARALAQSLQAKIRTRRRS